MNAQISRTPSLSMLCPLGHFASAARVYDCLAVVFCPTCDHSYKRDEVSAE